MWKKLKRPLAFVLTVAMLVSLTNFEQFSVLAEGAPETTTTAAESKTSEKAEEKNTEKSEKEESASEKTTAEKKESGESSDKGETKEDSEKKSSEEASEATTAKKEDSGSAEENSQEKTSENTAGDKEEEKSSEETAEKKEEKQTKKDTLTNQKIKANDKVTLEGKMPEGASATAKSVSVDIEGQVVLAAYDITIYDADGKEYQPEDGAIRVKIETSSVKEAVEERKDVSLYHMKDTGSTPEKITDKASMTQTEKGIAFDAESFSVYVVTKPETHFTLTYQFRDEEGRELTGKIFKQILSDDETLSEPETPDKDSKVFVGWYTAKSGGEKFTGFGSTARELNGGTLSKSKTVDLYARYEIAYYVFYMADNSDTDTPKVLYTQKYTDGSKVDASDVPFATDTENALVGWSTTKNATTPDTEWTINKADITLYPVIKSAHWITYDSQGGSIVEPVYVLSESNTAEPEKPKRAGYTFGGWYTDKACTQRFTFGSTLSASITLYAKWTAKEVNYTIVYWQQNPDDDNYSYKESEKALGLTGRTTEVNPLSNKLSKKYDGFSVSTTNTVQQQTIAGDGSTVVNVYYDRKTYTVKFYKSTTTGGGWWEPPTTTWTEIEELRITARYGQNISDRWPSKRTDLSTTYPANWKISETGGTYQSGIETMPLDGTNFYLPDADGNYTIRTDYYLENLTGDDYELDHSDIFKSDNRDWRTTKNDYYDIKGFTVKMSGDPYSPPVGSSAEALWRDKRNTYGWKFYYTRNIYDITFMDGETPLNTARYRYEADISEAGFTPEGKEGYTFGGWYENDQLQGDPYSFDNKTMPAGNMILYAKWTPDTYTVKFDLNGAKVAEGDTRYDNQVVEKGGLARQPEDPTQEGYIFAGWKRNDTAFSFTTPIQANTTLVAQWLSSKQYSITYDPGFGSGTAKTDTKTYSSGAKVKVDSVDSNWKAPKNSDGFICWNTKKDGSGTNIYPNDEYEMPDGNVTLYAQWAPVRTTTLTYDYNGGVDKDNNTKTTVVNILVPNGETEVADFNGKITRDGYEFIGWSTNQDETDESKLIKAGEKVQVDTITPENNVLYAQWKVAEKTLTIKKVVKGNMAEKDATFNFTVTSSKVMKNLNGTSDDTLSSDAKSASLGIKNGETVTVKVSVDADVTIKETNAAGYDTSYAVGSGQTEGTLSSGVYTISRIANDTDVTVTNEKDVKAPTAMVITYMPYILILGGAAALFVVMIMERKRKTGRDNRY